MSSLLWMQSLRRSKYTQRVSSFLGLTCHRNSVQMLLILHTISSSSTQSSIQYFIATVYLYITPLPDSREQRDLDRCLVRRQSLTAQCRRDSVKARVCEAAQCWKRHFACHLATT